MRWRRLLFAFLTTTLTARSATVMVLQFHNNSQYPDLNWVGESISQKLQLEFGAANQIVLGREAVGKGLRRLGLRPDADFTKATIIKLGENLDVDYVCYGSFEIDSAMLPTAGTDDSKETAPQLKDSSVQIAAHFLDLRKMRDGKDLSEAGRLTDLSRLEEHLAWQSLVYLDPAVSRPLDQFLNPQKFIRLEAEESYARGLLSTTTDSQRQWFRQATILDSRFVSPAYELGKLAAIRRDYRQAMNWFNRVPASDPRYAEARFRMGNAAYKAGDFRAAAETFREVAKTLPLNEVYNNLGAAENQLNLPAAEEDLRRAAEGDRNDPVYLFNLGAVLLKLNNFEEAKRWLAAALELNPEDSQAKTLLDRASRQEATSAGGHPLVPDRLKQHVNETAFRQLKAMLQPKASNL